MTAFAGFPRETFSFLEGMAANNDKAWFEANRPLYEAGYLAPARAFVDVMGPRLRALSPAVQFEARVNGSISRVNRDTRFSRDKRPYKDHLDLWFWHGERKGWTQPGFFMRLSAEAVWLGCGMHHFEDECMTRYREAVVNDRSGEALVKAIASVQAAGDYAVGGMDRKQVPRGYDKDGPRARFLRWESLPAMARVSPAEAQGPDVPDRAFVHFRNTWPVGQWLLDEVAAG